MTRRSLLIVAAALVTGICAPAARADTTTFKGRFVCEDRGVQLPLAGARVELYAQKEAVGFAPILDPIATTLNGAVGLAVPDFVRFSSAITDSDGGWSFTVPQTDPNLSFFVVAFLDDGAGLTVSQFPSGGPIGTMTGDNQNDTALQDYHTQVFGGGACPVWLGLERAVGDYRQLMGANVPFGGVDVQYGTPGPGVPFTNYTTIDWPTDYPAGPQPGSQIAVIHEFWHAIRNFSLGSRGAFLREIGTLGARGSDPCARTSPQEAFNEGWPELWAGDYAPAPECAGVSSGDPSVEGMVAWTLREMAAGCPNPRRMVQVLLADGARIHTLDDFRSALRESCLAVPVDVGTVARFLVSPRVPGRLWVGSARAALAAARAQASRLGGLLPGADRRALRNCPRLPCTGVIAAKVTPTLLQGQLAQQRFLIATLAAQLAPSALRQASGRLTRALLNRIATTPGKLTAGLARIGEQSFNRALSIAAPLARRDHSLATRRLLAALRADRAALGKVRRRGGRLPGAFPYGKLGSAGQTKRVPTIGDISFGGFADGTVITSQTAASGATFGAASSLGFPRTQPAYVCADGPTVQSGAAVAPSCPGGPAGYMSSGTMARFTSPVTSVNVRVGTTEAVPGGFAAEVDGFDAAGNRVTDNAALVGSSTNGESAGLAQTVQLTAPPQDPIAYVALFFNSYYQGSAQLLFNNLAYSAP